MVLAYSDLAPRRAGAAFLAAQGPRHLCGSCHARKRKSGDWLCRACRAEIAPFEDNAPRVMLPKKHRKTHPHLWKEAA